MEERTWLLFKAQWTAGLCFNLCSNLCSKLSNQWFPVRATCAITHLCPVHCQAGYLSAIRVFVRHICDHARSIFSLFLPPTCTFLYCSSTKQPSRATMLSPWNGNHSSGNPLHRYLAPNMDSLRAYQPFKYWIYTRHLLINWNLVCGMDWSHHVHTQVTT